MEELRPGERMWSVATGSVNPFMKRSRKAVEYIKGLDGLRCVHPAGRGTLWFFASKDAAVRARNLMMGKGIKCGRNVCGFTVAADGVPEMDGLTGNDEG
jgi:hypothetical protein